MGVGVSLTRFKYAAIQENYTATVMVQSTFCQTKSSNKICTFLYTKSKNNDVFTFSFTTSFLVYLASVKYF